MRRSAKDQALRRAQAAGALGCGHGPDHDQRDGAADDDERHRGLTEAWYREQPTIRNITGEQFVAHLQHLTRRLASSSKPEAAFVTLGGEIEYHYVASD